MGFLQHRGMTKLYEPPMPKGVGEFRDSLEGFVIEQAYIDCFKRARTYQVDKYFSMAKEQYGYLRRIPSLKNNPVILHNLGMMK